MKISASKSSLIPHWWGNKDDHSVTHTYIDGERELTDELVHKPASPFECNDYYKKDLAQARNILRLLECLVANQNGGMDLDYSACAGLSDVLMHVRDLLEEKQGF